MQIVKPSPLYRGKQVGEVGFRVESQIGQDMHVRFHDCSAPDSAREWLHEQLDGFILSTIVKHRDELFQHALAGLRQRFADGVQGLRKSADEREAEAQKILAIIESQKH